MPAIRLLTVDARDRSQLRRLWSMLIRGLPTMAIEPVSPIMMTCPWAKSTLSVMLTLAGYPTLELFGKALANEASRPMPPRQTDPAYHMGVATVSSTGTTMLPFTGPVGLRIPAIVAVLPPI